MTPPVRKLKIVALIVAVMAAGLVAAAWLAMYAPPQDRTQLTQAEARKAARAAESVKAKVRQVGVAAGEGRREQFELSIGERELTDFLRSDKHTSGALKARDLDSPQIEFQGQRIVTSCMVNVRGRKVHVAIDGKLSRTSEGSMVFRSDSVLLGKLPAPPLIRRKVDKAINDYLLLGRIILPADVTEIRSDDGSLVIKGVSDPDAISPDK